MDLAQKMAEYFLRVPELVSVVGLTVVDRSLFL
jgi:hypothetical protein